MIGTFLPGILCDPRDKEIMQTESIFHLSKYKGFVDTTKGS